MWAGHALYALAWASFGLGHSVLARLSVQRRLKPLFGPWYRLSYNVFALLHFALVLAVGRWAVGLEPFAWPFWLHGSMWAVHATGWAVLLTAGRWYDLGRFSGITQIRRGIDEPDDEPLHIDGPHRYIRHPLYAGAYLILWGAAQSPLGLATAVWGSLYLAVGTWFEERKLLALYGQAYADYRRQVPALIPWRGRRV